MTYHTTSKGIAALGRNGDDTLLHVKKDELAGLEALLGPVTVNPNTGLPEAFSWTDILKSLGIGLAGALTGGAAAPALGAIGATAVGAGTGALLGGGISAAEGKGFGPGALGGLISGGMGGYGGADLPGGAAPIKTEIAGPVQVGQAAPVMETTPAYTNALSQQGSAMMTKPGMEYLMKPVGMGALLGGTAEGTMEQASVGAQQLRAEKLKKRISDEQQRDYFASIGFPLPEGAAGTSWQPNEQRNYFDNLIYGAAAGGPMELSRTVGGVPINTTVPAKYVNQFEQSNLQDTLGPAMQDVQGFTANVANNLQQQGYANGGYVNTQPFEPQQFYPQSRIQSAQPYAAAGNTRVIDTLSDGASFAKGGFLDGPGDGMSDDIPANIDGQEEVRLADGEFIIPPEMVSLIGGGDSEEGKRLLDQLLPMVRQAAHGKKQQVKQDAGKLAAEKLLIKKKARGDAGSSGIEAASPH